MRKTTRAIPSPVSSHLSLNRSEAGESSCFLAQSLPLTFQISLLFLAPVKRGRSSTYTGVISFHSFGREGKAEESHIWNVSRAASPRKTGPPARASGRWTWRSVGGQTNTIDKNSWKALAYCTNSAANVLVMFFHLDFYIHILVMARDCLWNVDGPNTALNSYHAPCTISPTPTGLIVEHCKHSYSLSVFSTVRSLEVSSTDNYLMNGPLSTIERKREHMRIGAGVFSPLEGVFSTQSCFYIQDYQLDLEWCWMRTALTGFKNESPPLQTQSLLEMLLLFIYSSSWIWAEYPNSCFAFCLVFIYCYMKIACFTKLSCFKF